MDFIFFFVSRDTTNSVKMQPTAWKKILVNNMYDKKLIFCVYK